MPRRKSDNLAGCPLTVTVVTCITARVVILPLGSETVILLLGRSMETNFISLPGFPCLAKVAGHRQVSTTPTAMATYEMRRFIQFPSVNPNIPDTGAQCNQREIRVLNK